MRLCILTFLLIGSSAFPALSEDLSAGDLTNYKPETPKQRWNQLLVDTVGSPAPYLAAAAAAGIDQISNKPKEWGQGAEGFGDRFGSRFGRYAMTTTFSEATEAAFGLDTRYVRSGSRGFWRRAGYAVAATFFSYDSAGHRRFDPGPVIGSYSSGILATRLWYPSRYDPLSKGLNLGTAELTSFPIGNLLREFRPELKRVLDKVKLGGLLPGGME